MMSARARALLTVFASLALIAVVGASSGGAPARGPVVAGVLFTDEAQPGAFESGLWLVTPGGRVTRLLGRSWHPWAISKTG
jgi:hypothetical protein